MFTLLFDCTREMKTRLATYSAFDCPNPCDLPWKLQENIMYIAAEAARVGFFFGGGL